MARFDGIRGRSRIVLLTALLAGTSLLFIIFHYTFSRDSQRWPGAASRESNNTGPQSYYWDTQSAFAAVDAGTAKHGSVSQLCRSFPSHLLADIQPVMRTAYATAAERVPVQLDGPSACLDDLLIFSDLDQTFRGHKSIDAIALIPAIMREQSKDAIAQLESYDDLRASAANGSLGELDVIALEGWKTDKFKSLPSISQTWAMRPDREWYVFYEDDTYILWDNLFRLLDHYDPDLPFYFGSPSAGCRQLGQLTWFGYGGAGYILSREAMRRLVKHDWDASGLYLGPKLQEAHWDRTLDVCCGDTLLGCVLAKEQVTLGGLYPMLTPHQSDQIPFSEQHWCQPALSMHKPSADGMRQLWRWEWEHRQRDRPLLWRDLAISYFNFTELGHRAHWDNTGRSSFRADTITEHYNDDPHQSAIHCESACAALPKCLQWTYSPEKCSLDNSMRYGQHRLADSYIRDAGVQYTAGWMQEKISRFNNEHPCENVEWLRPSLDRIF